MAQTLTLEQGKRYTAKISLGMLERLAGNETIASKFREVGFTDVTVSGSGAERAATGVWPESSREVTLPKEVVEVSPA
jgi:hypothetical protein